MINKKLNEYIFSLRWISFISRKFSKVERKGKSSITTKLASLGVCFGVMTLIVTISVMNGFQMGFIDSIMEISSYHVRVKNVKNENDFVSWCNNQKQILSVTPFYEAQSLMIGSRAKQSASLVRAVPSDIIDKDKGFAKECVMISGKFDLSGIDGIVLGSGLARSLGVRVGNRVSILALSGSSDVSLLSKDRVFTVRGIFQSGYIDINSSYSFISSMAGQKYFGESITPVYGIKLKNSNDDNFFISSLKKNFSTQEIESWRSYNKTFFGALRVEKNVLMLLVLLIFLVVAVNIYNGMRRMVYERLEEIAVISALGGKISEVQNIFVMQGFLTGIKGAIPGLIMGLFICVRMESVFNILSKIEYALSYIMTMIISPTSISSITENPMFSVYAAIPARIFPGEVLAITLFGIFSSLIAALIASRSILKMTVAEVLRND